jgi:hypothetical protein
VGVGKSSIPRGGAKKFGYDRRDEVVYRRHLFSFKKAFRDFIYHNPSSSKLSSAIPKVEKAKCTGVVKEKQPKEPHNLS